MSNFELYKLAVEQFREQPRIYWIRARFFVTIQSALLSFLAFQLREDMSPSIAEVLLTLLGLVISVVWAAITMASRNLIGAWRKVVLNLETRNYHLPDSTATGADAFEGLFRNSGSHGEGTTFKLSITRMMNILAFVFMTIWGVISIYVGYVFIVALP